MKPFLLTPLLASLLVMQGCIHGLSLRSADGKRLNGSYRFARGDTGLIKITGINGEIFFGTFAQVGRASFVESYQRTFGSGSITANGLDAAPYAPLFGGVFASSYAITGSAHREVSGETPAHSPNVVKGPLFYWTAFLQGDKGTTMACYFIGSSYTSHGFGSCKSHTGEEYSAEF